MPFAVHEPDQFVLPLTQRGQILSGAHERVDAYPGLADWTRRAEAIWSEHSSGKMTLSEQINHMSKLTQQVPVPGMRVVYAKAGMHVAAALLTDPRVIVDHTLYWASVQTEAEGQFLVGILNAPVITELVRPLMSYGKDERHIDKHVWKLPIPTFDPGSEVHREISDLASRLAEEVAGMTFDSTYFVTIRQRIRNYFSRSTDGRRLNELVAQLLDTDLQDAVTVEQVPQPALLRTTDGPVPVQRATVEIDVDCEFDENGVVYLWGATVTTPGEEPTYHQFGSADPEVDEVTIAAEFAAWLEAVVQQARDQGHDVYWYHYGSVELTHLQRLLDPEVFDRLAPLGVDLLNDVIRPHHFAPNGYGLKHLAAEVAGAEWRTPGARGRDALDWIQRARAGDLDAWQRLVQYNEDDTHATRLLRHAMTAAESGTERLLEI